MSETQIFGLIKDLGAIAVLGLVVLMFLRGELISRKTLETILEAQKSQTFKMAQEISSEIGRAVKTAILEAKDCITRDNGK